MSRPRLALICAALCALAVAPATSHAAGTITGTVFLDYNSNGAKDVGTFVSGSTVKATDAPAAGVVVKAYDRTGTEVGTATTGADGTYVLTTTASGLLRVQFTTPTGSEPSFYGPQDGTSVQFVVAGSTGVDFGIVDVAQYCQDNPRLITCLQPATDEMTTYPSSKGIVTTPAAFGSTQTFTQDGGAKGTETAALTGRDTSIATMPNIGATFGVGVDRTGNAYVGTYVKRHSPYGPAGAKNAIYRVNIATGGVSTFVDLGGTLPAHSDVVPDGSFPDYAQDGRRDLTQGETGHSSVYFDVGRTGLGDVDVTPDGSAVLAVEMTEDASQLWRVPINGSGSSVTAGTPVPSAINAPATFGGVACEGKWHPMGIGVRGERVVVGGVCGGDESRFVDPATGRTEAAAFVLEATRVLPGATYTFATIAAFPLGYPKGGSSSGETLYSVADGRTGLWNNWHDGPVLVSGQPRNPGMGKPKPMLANIEIMDDGDLTIALRDRFYDQVKPCGSVWFEWDGTGSVLEQDCNRAAAAELLRLCQTSSGYEREQAGSCNGVGGANLPQLLMNASAANRDASPLYYAVPYGVGPTYITHGYTGLGGAATLPGSPVVWSTTYDINSIYQQGIRALGPCAARTGDGTCGPAGANDGAMIGGTILRSAPVGTTKPASSYSFYKGNGLGDLELVCDAAPVQIGNRVWLDSNKDGIQNPGEPAVAGVTARLYSGSTLVGTAVTGPDGTYYFSSTSTAGAAGDGTNIGGGLKPGETFTVKFDKPEDYAAGGPLFGLALTTANVTTAGTAVNSKATMSGGYPVISIPSRTAGQNNHTFDVGFVTTAVVGMGDYTWVDANRNGLQDADEAPLAGVKVELLYPDGTPAKDADGVLVALATTDDKGYYFIGNLLPESYVARFTLPSGYVFTTPNVGPSGQDSKPVPTTDPLVGLTPVFAIGASVSGDTTAVTKPNAAFANLTIDAGVVIAPTSEASSASSTTRGAGAAAPLVAIGDYTWIDTNRNGVQDEKPLRGVRVELLTRSGQRVRNAAGNRTPIKRTNARGYYVFDCLKPGSYKVRFILEPGYRFTVPARGNAVNNSNPIPSKRNPLIGVTPVFEVHGAVMGNTVRNTDPRLCATYIDPTIDAGVVRATVIGGGEGVTG